MATGSTGVVAMVLLAPGLFVASIERFVGMLPPVVPRAARRGPADRHPDHGPAGDRLAVAAAVLYSLPFYAAVILAQYFMLHAVGAHVSLFEVALGAPLVCAVTLLPVTVNGLFLAEGAFVLVYASVGVAPETALAAAILRRLVDLANSGFGGLLWLAWQTDPEDPGFPIEPERRVARAPTRSGGRRRRCATGSAGVSSRSAAAAERAGGAVVDPARPAPVELSRVHPDDAATRLRWRGAGPVVQAGPPVQPPAVRAPGPVCLLDLRGPACSGWSG